MSEDKEPEVPWTITEIEISPDTPLADKLRQLAKAVPVLVSMAHLEAAAMLEDWRVKYKLRAADLAGLKADLKAARKAQESKGQSTALADLGEIHRLHPAIDFQGDFMSIGFRVDLPENETGLLLIVSDGREVRGEVGPETAIIGERVFQVAAGTPPRLADVWGLERVKAFIAQPTRPKNLYSDIVEAFRTYLDLPAATYGLLAAWATATYFAHMFTAFPFLHFHGPKESGKSKTLEALRFVCFSAWKGRDLSAPALGDSCEGQRGTVLIDQAEKLNNEKETGNLIGLLADGYKKAGGQRRVIEMTKAGRRVLEFSTYGPKAFASTKALDMDLADRSIKISMVRTRQRLPDLEGWEKCWGELRDKCYRFTLAAFREVGAAYLGIAGDGSRIGELWRPLGAVLKVLGVEQAEVGLIRDLFTAQSLETRSEVSGWELTLLEILREQAEGEKGDFELSGNEILELMDITGDYKPGNKWVGEALAKYNLYGSKGRAVRQGKKITAYKFTPTRVLELVAIYLREDGQTGQTSTCPPEKVCPPETPAITEVEGGGQTGQTYPGDTLNKKNDDVFAQGPKPPMKCRVCYWLSPDHDSCLDGPQRKGTRPLRPERCKYYQPLWQGKYRFHDEQGSMEVINHSIYEM